MQLVEHCLANEAEERPSAEEVMQQLEQMEIDDPYQNLTRLEMMRMVGQKEEEIRQTVEESQRKDKSSCQPKNRNYWPKRRPSKISCQLKNKNC